jgi:stage II sporulation protein D
MKPRRLWLMLIAAFAVTVVPGILLMLPNVDETNTLKQDEKVEPVLMIHVYLTESKKVIHVPIESYITGVVAAEMPADFALEALKAQAIAARTYIIRRLVQGDFSDVPDGAVVSDTINHQAYRTDEELKTGWGLAYPYKISRIKKAVEETAGQVITYQGRPIDATFFSTSNGFTENARDYWGQDIPYLQSVPSPWDEASPEFETTVQMPAAKVAKKLQVDLTQAVSVPSQWIKLIDRTEGHRVKDISIGGKLFSGREVREKLGLQSSDFTMRLSGDQVIITTKGYGHGVGMSQFGADGMAKAGKTAEEILRYYYKGIEIADYRQWLNARL